MTPCFGYVRVSTKKQGEGASLQAQKDAITAFANQNKLQVTEWFEELETAAKRGRPVFNRMLGKLIKGPVKAVIFHKIDRSARNLKDWSVVSELPEQGVSVHIATESIDFESRGGRLTADMLAVIAADFIRNHRTEVKKGQRARLQQGLYPFRAPIGYLDNNTRADTSKRRDLPKRVCPVKGPLVKELFRLYASGQYSIRALIPEMKARGLRNHAGKPLTKHGIETILRNPFYTGVIYLRASGQAFDGIHEPLIDPATFKRVRDIKAGRAGKKVTRHNHRYRGLFRCAYCDGPMSPEKQKGTVYYRCQAPLCPTTTVREDTLEAKIETMLGQMQYGKAVTDTLMKDWQKWISSDARFERANSVDLRLAELTARMDRMTDMFIDGSLTEADFNRRKETLLLEKAQLESERQELEQEHLPRDEMQKFLELMKALKTLYKLAKPEERRWMVETWFSNRKVRGREPCLEPYSWLLSQNICVLAPYVKKHAPVIEQMLEIGRRDVDPPKIPQWKYNLKNQKHSQYGREVP